jgi:hypothetical protein
MGCHPVAVVILHLNYVKPTKFKTGGPHEKHVVATWNLGSHLSIYLYSEPNAITSLNISHRLVFITETVFSVRCEQEFCN